MEAQSWLLAYKGRAKQGFLRALLPYPEVLDAPLWEELVINGTLAQSKETLRHVAATLMILLRTRSGALYNVR